MHFNYKYLHSLFLSFSAPSVSEAFGEWVVVDLQLSDLEKKKKKRGFKEIKKYNPVHLI